MSLLDSAPAGTPSFAVPLPPPVPVSVSVLVPVLAAVPVLATVTVALVLNLCAEPYDPHFLDDPVLTTGRHRTVMNLASYRVLLLFLLTYI